MFSFSHWLSFYWFVLLPLVSWTATITLYRTHRHRGLFQKTSHWLLTALLAAQVYVSLLIFSSLYETALWAPAGALLTVPLLAFATYRAYLQPLDPLEEQPPDPPQFGETARSFGMFVLAVAISGYVLSQQVGRWPGLWLVPLVLLSPLVITMRLGRRLQLAPLLLALVALVFSWQTVKMRDALPPGRWRTTMTGASCSSTVQMDLGRKNAWCTDESTGQVYRFSPRTGFVDQGQIVEYGAQAFTADSNQVWIMQNPVKGLVMVENGSQMEVRINMARQGTLDRDGRLWVIDVSGFLWVSERGQDWERINIEDGLLDNTANFVKSSPDGSVWVGSVSGVSILLPDQSGWRNITRQDGLPGGVISFAFGTNGDSWYLWETISAYQENRRWGVSRWDGSHWKHIELGARVGLDIPTSQHAIAVDGLGRVWFVAPSYKQHINYLGILTPDTGHVSVYMLGPFSTAPGGFPIPGFHGVVDDGNGGIYLYNPNFAPLRHWQPGRQEPEYRPCPQPCKIA